MFSRSLDVWSGSGSLSPLRPASRLAIARRRAPGVRRRRALVVSIVLASALIGADPARGDDLVHSANPAMTANPARPVSVGWPAGPARLAARPVPAEPAAPTVVRAGAGTFTFASGPGHVAGQLGPVVQYRVAVEDGVGVAVDAFAMAVEMVLGDERSWIAGGRGAAPSAVAAPPRGRSRSSCHRAPRRRCAAGGLDTDRYTSCRLAGQVIINPARWLEAVPDYGAPLETYQAYAINHEVGHQLGTATRRARAGPAGAGDAAADVRAAGVSANGWPYLAGGATPDAAIR